MKSLSIALGVCTIAIVLFFALNHYIYQEKQADPEVQVQLSDAIVEGVVTNVDLTAMAADGPAVVVIENLTGESVTIEVPSMGLPLCDASEAIADVSQLQVGDAVSVNGLKTEMGAIVPCESEAHYLTAERTYENTTLGYSFSYRVGPNGYVLTEATSTMSTDEDFLGGVTLMLASEVATLDSRVGGEGPPAITIRVYENSALASAPNFATSHPLESNIELISGDSAEYVLGGANVVRYLVDGLYPTDTIVATHASNAYLLSGSYLTEDSFERNDFLGILNSFTFIPEV